MGIMCKLFRNTIIMKTKKTLKFARDCTRDIKNKFRLKTNFLAAKRSGDILKRMEDFDVLFEHSDGASVLDIGCYDGLIAYEFFRNGASLIHGLDNDAYHLDTAARIFSQVDIPSKFAHADLRKKNAIQNTLAESFQGEYDLVLFLGVFQHIYKQMNEEARQSLVNTIVNSARDVLAIRIPEQTWEIFKKYFSEKSFELVQQTPHKGNVGEFRIYRRV